MSLDLDDVTGDWPCPPGEICARLVNGRDGQPFVQLRVEMGVLQMLLDGRPDGARYHGLPSSAEYISHELRVGRELEQGDWRELDRELAQLNYRRLAFACLGEECLRRNDRAGAAGNLRRALRDIDLCLKSGDLVDAHRPREAGEATLRPVLIFNRDRLTAQLLVVEGLYDEAVEAAEAGVRELGRLLGDMGVDGEHIEQDAGVVFLTQLAARLRKQYGIPLTLRERLEAAVEREDFETAAQLRQELRQREEQARGKLLPGPPQE